MKAAVIIIALVILIVLFVGYAPKTIWSSSKGKIRIAMAGRSTMGLWFKHWNWPLPLRFTISHKYIKNNLMLEYLQISGPGGEKARPAYGERMIRSFKEGLDKENYQAAFFKFCFVDFPIENDRWEERFQGLTHITEEIYKITNEKKIPLVIGNALPIQRPNEATICLQRAYNKWAADFRIGKKDITIFDFYGVLGDQEGKLRKEFARGPSDDHPNNRAFAILDEFLFKNLSMAVGK